MFLLNRSLTKPQDRTYPYSNRSAQYGRSTHISMLVVARDLNGVGPNRLCWRILPAGDSALNTSSCRRSSARRISSSTPPRMSSSRSAITRLRVQPYYFPDRVPTQVVVIRISVHLVELNPWLACSLTRWQPRTGRELFGRGARCCGCAAAKTGPNCVLAKKSSEPTCRKTTNRTKKRTSVPNKTNKINKNSIMID